jgi:hypothetical protein
MAQNGRLTPRVEPVGGKEHREEQHDHGVTSECVPESLDFGLPGWVTDGSYFCSVGPYHLIGVSHYRREHNSGERQADESDLLMELSTFEEVGSRLSAHMCYYRLDEIRQHPSRSNWIYVPDLPELACECR